MLPALAAGARHSVSYDSLALVLDVVERGRLARPCIRVRGIATLSVLLDLNSRRSVLERTNGTFPEDQIISHRFSPLSFTKVGYLHSEPASGFQITNCCRTLLTAAGGKYNLPRTRVTGCLVKCIMHALMIIYRSSRFKLQSISAGFRF